MSKDLDVNSLKPGDIGPDGKPLSSYGIWKLKHPDKVKAKEDAAVAPKEAKAAVPAAPKIEEPKKESKTPEAAPKPDAPQKNSKTKTSAPSAAQASLESLYADLRKEYGDESFVVPAFTNESTYPRVKRIPVSSPNIMDLTGGGLPFSRNIELFGDESSGKTSLACYFAGQVQQAGGIAAYIDVEQALDLEYAKTFGLDTDHMLFSQPSSGEDALNQVITLVKKQVDIIIVDSVAMLVPQAEIDGEMGDQHMALQARMMSKALRKITAEQANSKTIIVWISQTRVAIGQWAPHGQIPKSTSGGNSLKFAASIRIEVKKREVEIDPKTEEGTSQLIRLKTVKNKVAPPLRVREVRIRFGYGIDTLRDWFDHAVTFNIIVKRGGGHLFPDGHKEPSGDKAWAYFQSMSTDAREATIEATREAMGKQASVPSVITQETVDTGVSQTTRVSDDDDSGDDEE